MVFLEGLYLFPIVCHHEVMSLKKGKMDSFSVSVGGENIDIDAPHPPVPQEIIFR